MLRLCHEEWSMFKATTLAFIFTLSLLVATPVSAQPRCKEKEVWANGSPGMVRVAARQRAQVAWLVKVHREFGEAYAKWGKAKDRRTSCVREHRQFTCTVSARPCRA